MRHLDQCASAKMEPLRRFHFGGSRSKPAERVRPRVNNSTSDPPLDAEAIKAKLEALRSEHRDLDEVIDRLVEKPPFDQLQLQRLKKRKLGLKDQIIRLESQLIPDIIA
jgi:hypothetical protein